MPSPQLLLASHIVAYNPFAQSIRQQSGAFVLPISQRGGECMPKLTNKQKRFCEEYLIDLNATQAAIRAGYPVKRASEQAYQLLQKTTVSAYIEKLRQEQQQRTQITADAVLGELAKIAAAEDVQITGKEKIKALELLGKHLGLFQNGADNSAALEKLDEVLGKIGGSF